MSDSRSIYAYVGDPSMVQMLLHDVQHASPLGHNDTAAKGRTDKVKFPVSLALGGGGLDQGTK